jgi:HEAT repeat protein
MNSEEINKCIQLLHKKPKWFLQREDIDEKLRCFDLIGKYGIPSTIYHLTDFLKSENDFIRQKCAEIILLLFNRLKPGKGFNNSLKHLQIDKNDLSRYRTIFSENIYLQLVHIASLNGGGYTREFAVGEIIRLNKQESLKFLLFRIGDWVVPVREIATAGINYFLRIEIIDQFIRELPTIDALLQVKRVDLKPIHNRIIAFILGAEFTGEFQMRISRFDDKIRLRYFRHFLQHFKPGEEELRKIACDKNFLVRLEVLNLLPQYEKTFQREMIGQFLADHSARIRIQALYATKSFKGEFDNKIFNLLSDESAAVRELSRQLLKHRNFSFADIYVERITKGLFLSGSLSGLYELGGNAIHLSIFEKYIKDYRGSFIITCLSAINQISPEKAKEYALYLLKHSGKRVRFKAVEVLAKNCDIGSLEKVRAIYHEGNVEIKKTILSLYSRVGGYKIIGDLLIVLADENSVVQDMAWQMLSKWKMKATKLFTTPAKGEIERALFIYHKLDKNKLQLTKSRERLLQDLQFYIR